MYAVECFSSWGSCAIQLEVVVYFRSANGTFYRVRLVFENNYYIFKYNKNAINNTYAIKENDISILAKMLFKQCHTINSLSSLITFSIQDLNIWQVRVK